MEMDRLLDHLDKRLDRLEEKLETHAESHVDLTSRVSKVESDVSWLRSTARYLWVVILGTVGKLAHMSFTKL
jgi:hypothetical protein